MLYQFLSETTIHGLRYLVVAKTLLVRLVWAVVILISAALAVAFIYLNIKRWLDSPSIITSVRPVSVMVRIRFNIRINIGVRYVKIRALGQGVHAYADDLPETAQLEQPPVQPLGE